jgi:NAD(P)-dependent dehydrogenase (short-subunit alcohol dehydrogenase family)
VPAGHLVPDQVRALAGRIRAGHGRLDVLVNDIWGGEMLVEWGKPVPPAAVRRRTTTCPGSR